ncbi:GTPase-activating protein [Apophysomyces ossiformis]|uniref:GTPase-activating protein n=1 Tax=Apophysomyces ossiformis TaxID=679940 RepID=A0A8H7BTG1_9FUNG|nr:GTPase-activating protein [Apophysomyces ossiformis]
MLGLRSFWRRRGLKFPGSVSIVISPSQGTNDAKPPVVIGARYAYTSLVTSQSNNANAPAVPLLPSQYPSSKHKHSLSTQNVSLKSTSPKRSSSPNYTTTLRQHHRSTSSPNKSFNAFLMDTNEEWSDDLNYTDASSKDTSPRPYRSSHSRALSKSSDSLSQRESAYAASRSSLSSEPATHQSIDKQKSPSLKPMVSKEKQSCNADGLKINVQDLLQDPTNLLQHIVVEESADPLRTKKFKEVLSNPNVDLTALRTLSWSGIPKEFRLMAWQLLLGYLPCNSARRVATLARKRKEYADSVAATYSRGTSGLDQTLWRQIHIDIPRTNPGIPLYQYEATQLCLERILYQWAIRHPASGYVQGINDLVTPIFEVFLSTYIDEDPEEYDVSKLAPEVLAVIEADSFWCLSKFLDGIQDNYTFAQPGIQRQIATLKELVCRIDARLASHLQELGIEFIQFAFRWMNCLLMRELPLKSTIRMWDTYLAEGSSEGFSEFHVYVCAAFLVKWSDQLQKLDFQDVMLFLQQVPTQGWGEKDVELLLSEAYMWKTLFHNAPSHLK